MELLYLGPLAHDKVAPNREQFHFWCDILLTDPIITLICHLTTFSTSSDVFLNILFSNFRRSKYALTPSPNIELGKLGSVDLLGGISPGLSKCAIIARSIEKQVVALHAVRQAGRLAGKMVSLKEDEMDGSWIHA